MQAIDSYEVARGAVVPMVDVDWGRRRRGAGRRAGAQVMGAMADPPTGIRRYPDFRSAVPEGMSDPEWDEVKLFDDEDKRLYVGLRQAGRDHEAAALAVYQQMNLRRAGGA